MRESFLSRFTPSLLKPETLEAIFVQREALAKRLVAGIRESAQSENKHYFLLIGPRGIGKTHLVSLVYHRVRADRNANERLRIAWLREDEWGVASFLDFLLAILRALLEERPNDDLAGNYDALFKLKPDAAELKAEELLRETVGEKTLLVLTENLDETFRGLEQRGQEKLRAYIQNNPFFTILATSQSLFNGVSLRSSPFYGFFEPQHLQELSFDECVSMLGKIAAEEGDEELVSLIRTPKGRARIRAVHHLAAGNPRVYVIFAQFLTCESLSRLVQPLMQTLDDLTPYYQGRMNFLSPQQRKIVEFLCDRRHAVSVSEIAQGNFLTHQTTSAQLKKLRELGYVRAHQSGRESYYELREPLMRISLEVKKLRGEPIRLLVEFLQVWYSRTELARRLESLKPEAESEREYLVQALKAYQHKPEDATVSACLEDYHKHFAKGDFKQALRVAEELVGIRGYTSDWLAKAECVHELGRVAEGKKLIKKAFTLVPSDAGGWQDRGIELAEIGHPGEALVSFDKVLELNPRDVPAWVNRGASLARLERYDEALVCFDRGLELDPKDVPCWVHRGAVLGKLQRLEEALPCFDKALELDPENSLGWAIRGVFLDRLKRYEEAVVSYDKGLERDPDDVEGWVGRGGSLGRLERHEEALASFDKALEVNGRHGAAWWNRALALFYLERYEEALASCDRVLDLDPNQVDAWVKRAAALWHVERYEEAVASADKALALEPKSVAAWTNRGASLRCLERHEEALACYDEVLELEPENVRGWRNRATLLHHLQRHEEALESCDKVLKLDPKDSYGWTFCASLQYALGRVEDSLASSDRALELNRVDAVAWGNRGTALSILARDEEALAAFDKALERFVDERGPDGEPFWVRSGRAIGLMFLGRWDEGVASLDDALDRCAQGGGEDARKVGVVEDVLMRTRDVPTWRRFIEVWIELCERHGLLTELGWGIASSIHRLSIPWITDEAARAWYEVWDTMGSAHEELALPLRLLNAAVEYRAKPDKRVLLGLPVEERQLLEPLLGIPKSERTS